MDPTNNVTGFLIQYVIPPCSLLRRTVAYSAKPTSVLRGKRLPFVTKQSSGLVVRVSDY